MRTPMRESDVEAYLVEQCQAHGVFTRKVQWIARNGAPDRLLLGHEGRIAWCEVKAPGKAATFPSTPVEKAQFREHARMHARGQLVFVVDSFEGVDLVIRGLA